MAARKTAKGQTRRAWSPRSLNAAIDAWRLVLAYGCDRRELAHNVAASMKKVRARPTGDGHLHARGDPAGAAAADKDRNGHLWYLALSGLRRGEIAGRGGRTSTSTQAPHHCTQPGRGGHHSTVVENEPKTASSRRTLPLDDGLIAVLRRARRSRRRRSWPLGAAYADSGYVASNEAGSRTRRAC